MRLEDEFNIGYEISLQILREMNKKMCRFHALFHVFNPFTPTSDQDRTSPYNINTISCRQVMRIKKNINQRIGDEYQILRTNVLRIVWQTVRRMTRDLGVERISHFLYLFLSKTMKHFLVGKTKEFSNFKKPCRLFCRKQNWLFSNEIPLKLFPPRWGGYKLAHEQICTFSLLWNLIL